jgi:hypothetical protein
MPDAINHLASYNRIALALENMHPTDMTALAEAITALANKPTAPITVAPANPTITVSPANPTITVSPANPTITVAPANPTITVNAGSGTGGSSDCGSDMCDLIAKIDQLICVNAAMTAAMIQQSKADIYWSTDGPNLGIDAPHGSFVFPKPNDSAPPLPYTPWPDNNSTDNSGAWTAPPIVDGTYYVAPPGGMQGSSSLNIYDGYKCDIAAFIYNYIVSWFDFVIEKTDLFQFLNMQVSGLVLALDAISLYLSGHIPGVALISSSVGVIENAVAGVSFAKAGAKVGGTVLTVGESITIGAFLLGTSFIAWCVNLGASNYRGNIVAQKEKIMCALKKAKNSNEARENVMVVLNENVTHIVDFGQGSLMQGLFVRQILSDNLLAMLFACQADLDISTIEGLGAANGGCTGCTLCSNMDVTLPINQTSTANWVNLAPADRVGMVQYPITYPITLHGVLKLCAVVTAVTGAGANFTLKLFKNGSLVGSGWIHAGEGEEQEIGINCGRVSYWDLTPVPFEGNYTVTLECAGSASNRPTFSWKTLSYKDNTP